ncbi:hypothetical protein HDF24_19085 [Mucilaginibacter sp. X4EP1]|uniref:hypothetical protein n=1 Tax=Mucilaginibacter sp. X4EP1 TaxID=2723092 RepID=UPI0021680A81|nr:hypothetical protein [Mucilaginibacter sp. X4EP1]MCS3813320.1 hypothetical protein [Mucilaginibacter sp. X4EP1]
MKPKYMFYLFIMILIHYEVGRIVSISATQAADEQPSSNRGIKLDENEQHFVKPLGYDHEVRFISISNPRPKHVKLYKAVSKRS